MPDAEYSEYRKELTKVYWYAALAVTFAVFLVLMVMLIPTASATEINPSVENQPFFCKYAITKPLCNPDKPGPQGITGPQGEKGEQNYSLMAWNITNSTLTQNTTNAWNVSSSVINSNYTFYGGTEINESYAYLPGRDGGQTLTGGTTTGNLILNGSANNGDIILQPNGGNVGIGGASTGPILDIKRDGASAISFTGTGSKYLVLNRGSGGSNLTFTVSTASAGSYIQTMLVSPLYFGTNGAIRMTILGSGGNVGIGTTAPTAQFDTTGSVRFRNCSGTPTFDTGGNLTCASDPKLKTAVTTYTSDSAKVASVSPISYKWNAASGYDTTHTNTGFDAQQIAQIYPECIIARDDVVYSQVCDKEEECTTVEKKTGMQTLSIDDKCLIAVLFNNAKDQRTQITALQEENKKINERLTALEKGVKV